MKIKTEFNKNLKKWFLTPVLKAVETYGMFQDEDKVCVALSGGKDSITLLYILWLINRYTHRSIRLSALHIRTADYPVEPLAALCRELEVSFHERSIHKSSDPFYMETQEKPCYICTRLKRGAISTFLKERGITTIAYGHHADDAAETFFMNIAYNRKLGSFSPRVAFENNSMEMIRPMIYLEEKTIQAVHSWAGLPLLPFQCPFEETGKRKKFKAGIRELEHIFGIKEFTPNLIRALENPDRTNIWENLTKQER